MSSYRQSGTRMASIPASFKTNFFSKSENYAGNAMEGLMNRGDEQSTAFLSDAKVAGAGLLGAASAMQGGFAGKAAEAAGQAEGQASMASGLSSGIQSLVGGFA